VNTKIFVIENKRFESFPLFATSLISLREILTPILNISKEESNN
jgi:hypothetical protein